MKNKAAYTFVLALMFYVGAFLFPLTAHAASDTTPPTVTAEIIGDTLKVVAKDDVGVEAIYINEHRFSTLVNGTAAIPLKDYAGTGEKIAIYATDTAGNKSQVVLISNPYFKAPTPAPTSVPTPAPTQPAQSTPPPPSSTPVPATTPTPSSPSTPEPTEPTEPQPTGTGTAGTPEETNSGIPDNTNPFTPDGGGTVLDNATEREGKEFFTITATDGSVYYLIIDRQRGSENVYFLNAVTREDLLALSEDSGSASYVPGPTQPEPQIPAPTPEPQEPTPTEPPAQDNGGAGTGTIIFILLAAAIAGGAGYYFKIVKPRKDAARDDEFEYEDEEDSYGDAEDAEDMGDPQDLDGEYVYDEETDECIPGESGTDE